MTEGTSTFGASLGDHEVAQRGVEHQRRADEQRNRHHRPGREAAAAGADPGHAQDHGFVARSVDVGDEQAPARAVVAAARGADQAAGRRLRPLAFDADHAVAVLVVRRREGHRLRRVGRPQPRGLHCAQPAVDLRLDQPGHAVEQHLLALDGRNRGKAREQGLRQARHHPALAAARLGDEPGRADERAERVAAGPGVDIGLRLRRPVGHVAGLEEQQRALRHRLLDEQREHRRRQQHQRHRGRDQPADADVARAPLQRALARRGRGDVAVELGFQPGQAHAVAVEQQEAEPGRAVGRRAQQQRQVDVVQPAHVAGFEQQLGAATVRHPVGAFAQRGDELVEALGLGVDQVAKASPAADEGLVRHLQRHARRVLVVPEQVVHRADETVLDERPQVVARAAGAEDGRRVVDVHALLRVHAGVRVLEREPAQQRVELRALRARMALPGRLGPVLQAGTQGVGLVVERLRRAAGHGAGQVDLRDLRRHRQTAALALARRLPQPREQMLQQRQVVGVVRDRAHVAQHALEQRRLEPHRLGQGRIGVGGTRAQAQEALRGRDDRLAQLVLVEPAHQVGRAVDRVGQLQEPGAVVQVLAAHRQHDVAARVRVEEMIDHALDQQRRIVDAGVGRVEDLLELVDDEHQPHVGGVGPRRHGQLLGVGVHQAREARLLAEHLGDLVEAACVLLGAAARAQQRGELPGQARDRRVPAPAAFDPGRVRSRRADHRDPEVAGAGDAEAAQRRRHAGVDERGLARTRAAEHGDELGRAQAFDDLAHLTLAAEQQRGLEVQERAQTRVRLPRQAHALGGRRGSGRGGAVHQGAAIGSRFLRRSNTCCRKRFSSSCSSSTTSIACSSSALKRNTFQPQAGIGSWPCCGGIR